MRLTVFVAATAMMSASFVARADSVATFNFDNLPTGPSFFSQAGPPQTIVDSGVATFTGGVVLGDASNFPGIIYATAPNGYATAGFGDGTPNLLTISIAPGFGVHEVSFALFNGGQPNSFVVDAFSGTLLLSSQSFTGVAANTNSGYVLPDLMGQGITSVTISATNYDPSVNGYDYLIDTVAFNESIEQEVNVTPEPSSIFLLSTGLLGIAGVMRKRFA